MHKSSVPSNGAPDGPWLIKPSTDRRIDLSRLPAQRRAWLGYVYVVEMSNGTTKIGTTSKPLARIKAHVSDAAAHGFTIAQVWVSLGHLNSRDMEQHLLGYGRRNGASVQKNEYFTGLDFRKTVAFAEGLPYQWPTEALLAKLDRANEEHEAKLRALAEWILEDGPSGGLRDALDGLRHHVGRYLWLRQDGTYRLPGVLPIEGDLDALWDALGQLAEATGKPMKDVLGLSPLDMIEMALQDMVRAEILKVKGHALEAGETGILEPVGDAILRVHRERRAVVPAV